MRRSRARAGATGANFLDPQVLSRIDNLELLARTVVDGFVHGLHRSPYLGLSLDFAEHRSYMPGDDIRRIDWKLYARTDRHYVKQFEAETNADFLVLLDVSASMGYGSGKVTKLDYARYLAACLSYFSSRQRDRVGLTTFDRDVVEVVPPSGRHLDLVLHALATATAGRPGALPDAMGRIVAGLRRRGIVAVISDFYHEPEEVGRALGLLAAAGHDVMAFHLLDPDEIDFPFERASSFEDLETGEQVPVVPERLREIYRALVRDHSEALDGRLTATRVDYRLLDTSKPLDHALFHYLSRREKASRTR